MKNVLVKIIGIGVILLFFTDYNLSSQTKHRFYLPNPVVCKGHISTDTNRVFVRDTQLKSTMILETQKAVFEVDFFTSVPDEVKEAFNYAASRWSNYMYSSVPIRVRIYWTALEEGTLGSGAPYMVSPMPELPDTTLFYPVALAEKILGKEINGEDSYDIILYFNSDQERWYFGTDGNTPVDEYDLVSTIMHEIGHGLGFTGSFNVDGDGMGSYGYWDGVPKVFDIYVENGSHQRFVNESIFTNPSKKLGDNLTGEDVYFGGDFIVQQNGTNIPRLYAPSSWDVGSSISHLNDATYPKGNANSLMTHSTGSGEAIHSPGPLTLDIFSQMGWVRTNIQHTPLKDRENIGNVSVTAEIRSDAPSSVKEYKVHYSYDNFATTHEVSMDHTGDYNFQTTIPVSETGTTINYYITANDSYDRIFRKPFLAGDSYSFYVGEDKTKPEVEHYSIGYVFLGEDTVKIEASIDDNVAIKNAVVEYFVGHGEMQYVTMQNLEGTDYVANLIFDGSLKLNDTVYYRIVATDASSNMNVTNYPEGAYFYFNVESILDPVTEYFNDFNSYNNDFLGVKDQSFFDDEIVFVMSTPDGLDDGCLHTPNPYQGTLVDEEYHEYIAQLKYPILLQEGAVMRFDEIVLVEPGEIGTVFGSDEFWDYVIVEASDDNGKTWKALVNGYDCRMYREWEFLYNSEMNTSGENSLAVPTSSYYKSHHMSMLNKTGFEVGDVVLVRFRFQSDALATGWGWAIDNLQIQGDILSVEELSYQMNLDVYPNPAKDIINIDAFFNTNISTADIVLTDLSGKKILNEKVNVFGRNLNWKMNLSTYDRGLYLLKITANDQQKTVKLVHY